MFFIINKLNRNVISLNRIFGSSIIDKKYNFDWESKLQQIQLT